MPGIFSPARIYCREKTVYKDTANTDLVVHNGRFWRSGIFRGNRSRSISTLETIGAEDFGGKLPMNVSAHSKVDPATGEFVFFDYALYEPKMSFGTVSGDNRLVHFQEIALPGPRLPHDMGLTENHVILHDLPVCTDSAIRNRMWQIHVADQPTRFGVAQEKAAA